MTRLDSDLPNNAWEAKQFLKRIGIEPHDVAENGGDTSFADSVTKYTSEGRNHLATSENQDLIGLLVGFLIAPKWHIDYLINSRVCDQLRLTLGAGVVWSSRFSG